MANTATLLGQVPIGIERCGQGVITKGYNVLIDTVDTDLEVHDPAADAYWGILGLVYVETSAHILTIKSGSTIVVAMEVPANSGIVKPLGNEILATGFAKGAALNIRSSVAISSMLVYVQNFKYIRL